MAVQLSWVLDQLARRSRGEALDPEVQGELYRQALVFKRRLERLRQIDPDAWATVEFGAELEEVLATGVPA